MCLCSVCVPWLPMEHREFVDIDVSREGAYICMRLHLIQLLYKLCNSTTSYCDLHTASMNQLAFLCAALPYQVQYPTEELKHKIWCLWQLRLGWIYNLDWKAHTAMKAKEEQKENSFLFSRKNPTLPSFDKHPFMFAIPILTSLPK